MKKIVIMMALALVSSMTFAQRGPRADRDRSEERPDRERMHQVMAERLELTEAQQNKMEELKLAHLKATSDTRSQLDIKRAELEAAIKSEKPVDKLIGEIGKLENSLLEARIKHRIAMRNVLDDNQKLKFDQFHQGRHTGMRHHEGRGK